MCIKFTNTNTPPPPNPFLSLCTYADMPPVRGMRKHIDKIRVSFFCPNIKDFLTSFLKKNGYRVISDSRSKPSLERNKVFASERNKIVLTYNRKYKEKTLTPLITIHDPVEDDIELLHDIAKAVEKTPFGCLYTKIILNVVEYALDFYTDEQGRMQEWLENHLSVRYSRKASSRYKNTFYSSDTRKAAKAVRIYPKTIGGERVVRCELVVNRSIINQNITCLSLNEIAALDLQRYISFSELDLEGLAAYLVKREHEQVERLERRRPGMGNLMETHIWAWLTRNDVLGETEVRQPLMSRLYDLLYTKGWAGSYRRFLNPLVEFNEAVFSQPYEFGAGAGAESF